MSPTSNFALLDYESPRGSELSGRHAASARCRRTSLVVVPTSADDGGMVGRRACGPARAQAKAAHDLAVKQAFYRLADERRETILVACSKCDWWAAFPGTTSSLLMVRTTRCPTYSTISPHRVALPRQHLDRQRSPSLRSQRGSGMRRQRRRSRSTPTCSSRTTAARRPRSMPRSEGKP